MTVHRSNRPSSRGGSRLTPDGLCRCHSNSTFQQLWAGAMGLICVHHCHHYTMNTHTCSHRHACTHAAWSPVASAAVIWCFRTTMMPVRRQGQRQEKVVWGRRVEAQRMRTLVPPPARAHARAVQPCSPAASVLRLRLTAYTSGSRQCRGGWKCCLMSANARRKWTLSRKHTTALAHVRPPLPCSPTAPAQLHAQLRGWRGTGRRRIIAC